MINDDIFNEMYRSDIFGNIHCGGPVEGVNVPVFDSNTEIGDVTNQLLYRLNTYYFFKEHCENKGYLKQDVFTEFEKKYINDMVIEAIVDICRRRGVKVSAADIGIILDDLVVNDLIEKKF